MINFSNSYGAVFVTRFCWRGSGSEQNTMRGVRCSSVKCRLSGNEAAFQFEPLFVCLLFFLSYIFYIYILTQIPHGGCPGRWNKLETVAWHTNSQMHKKKSQKRFDETWKTYEVQDVLLTERCFDESSTNQIEYKQRLENQTEGEQIWPSFIIYIITCSNYYMLNVTSLKSFFSSVKK